MSKIPINLPARIIRGQTVTAAHMNALRESIYRLASRKDEQIKSLPGGGAQALKLVIVQGTAANKFQISPGVVNGVTPTLGGTAIDSATPPESTITETTYYWLKCVGTFGSPDSYVVTVQAETTAGVPTGTDISATGFVSFYYIGEVTVDTAPDPDTYTITNQHGGGNLGVDSWGLYNLWWRY